MKIVRTHFIGLLAIWTLAFVSCEKARSDDDASDAEFCIPDSLIKNITVDTVRSEPVQSALNLTGKIVFNENKVVKVFPVVSGLVTDVKVSLGDYVEKGQLMAAVRSADVAGYFNEYKSAQSELAIARKNLQVTMEMKSSGVSSEKDLLMAQSEYEKELAEFKKAEEVLKIYGNTTGAADSVSSVFSIRAPIGGFVVEKNINTGMELRQDESNNLFTISDLKEVYAVANVYESDIARIREGEGVEVTTLSYPDKKFTGRVERVSNIISPETDVMPVKIRLENSDYSLKPGMFANITVFFPENRKLLAVPSGAVLFDDNKSYVVHFRKRCDVDLQEVELVRSFGGKYFIVADSLAENDCVLDRNALFVFTALKKL